MDWLIDAVERLRRQILHWRAEPAEVLSTGTGVVMHKDRMNQLADLIERSAVFSMQHFGEVEIKKGAACGTAGCIAGHCSALMGLSEPARPLRPKASAFFGLEAVGERFLGLTRREAGILFFPCEIDANFEAYPFELGHITAAHAAAMLRLCAKRGDVRVQYWSQTRPWAPVSSAPAKESCENRLTTL